MQVLFTECQSCMWRLVILTVLYLTILSALR